MLTQGWQNRVNLLCYACLTEVIKLSRLCSKWLTNNHGPLILSVEHLFIFFTSQETNIKRIRQYRLPIILERTPNNMHIAIEEILIKVSTSSKINQINDILIFIKEVIGWIGVSLHHFEFKQLLEA